MIQALCEIGQYAAGVFFVAFVMWGLKQILEYRKAKRQSIIDMQAEMKIITETLDLLMATVNGFDSKFEGMREVKENVLNLVHFRLTKQFDRYQRMGCITKIDLQIMDKMYKGYEDLVPEDKSMEELVKRVHQLKIVEHYPQIGAQDDR